MPPSYWRALLRKHGLRPDKRLGQNFLVDPVGLRKVVQAARLQGDETVLDIGAGLGALTIRLAAAARRVIALEKDTRLMGALQEVTQGMGNIEILRADVLAIDLGELLGNGPYAVVANIPYYITSAILRKLMEMPHPARGVVLTVQREVAERVVAGPGSMSLLALGVQAYGQPRVVGRIPAGAFYPRPEVDSAILRIEPYESPLVEGEALELLFRLAKAGFGQKRKQLRNALSGGLGVPKEVVEAWLEAADIAPSRRAQELDLAEWRRLVASVGDGLALTAIGGGETAVDPKDLPDA